MRNTRTVEAGANAQQLMFPNCFSIGGGIATWCQLCCLCNVYYLYQGHAKREVAYLTTLFSGAVGDDAKNPRAAPLDHDLGDMPCASMYASNADMVVDSMAKGS